MNRIVICGALALATFVSVLRAPMAWASPVSSCAGDFSSCNIYEDGSTVLLPGLAISGDVVLLHGDHSVSDVFRIFNNFVDTGGGTGLGNLAFLYSDDEGNLPDPASYSANVTFIPEGGLIAPGLTETDFNGNGTIYHLFSAEPVQTTPVPPAWGMALFGFAGFAFMAYCRKSKPAFMAA
ncbi:MAG: hypothetical protein ACXWKC_06665 [Xanthobacteraceae bacterium]